MATGDLKNNLRKLKTELRFIKYNEEIPWQQINIGLTEPLLPILHYVFGDYSCEFTSYLGAKGYDFFCKSDLRFIEIVYKILISEFNSKPMLTKQQFFAVGFAEIKVIFVTKIISLCRTKNTAMLAKMRKLQKQAPVKRPVTMDSVVQKDDGHGVDFHIESNRNKIAPNTIQDDSANQKSTQYDVLDLTTEVDEVLDDVNNLVICNEKDNDSTSTARDVLDLTEIDGEDNIVKLIDDESQLFTVNEIDGNKLPRFTVLKHVLPEVKLVEESVVDQLDGAVKPKEMSEFSLESCNKCLTNTKNMNDMEIRIAKLEKQFAESMKINNELSAKVILLETKINLLECTSKNDEKEKHLDTSITTEGEQQSEQTKAYSPLKYSDDETIMKGFHPITMKDVQNAQGIDFGRIGDKENQPPVLEIHQIDKEYHTSSNRKISFNSRTKETISNVEKYFHDADRLLSTHSSVEKFVNH